MRSTLLSVLLVAGFAVLGATANLEVYETENKHFLETSKHKDKGKNKNGRGGKSKNDNENIIRIPSAYV